MMERFHKYDFFDNFDFLINHKFISKNEYREI